MTYRIAVAEVRLRVWSEEEAQAAIAAEQQAHGAARVALTYHAGRPERDGRTPYFIRGTLQYEIGAPPTIVTPPTTHAPPARPRQAARKQAPKPRKVSTPPSLGKTGIFIKYDETQKGYVAIGTLGAVAGWRSSVKKLKRDAVAAAEAYVRQLERAATGPTQQLRRNP